MPRMSKMQNAIQELEKEIEDAEKRLEVRIGTLRALKKIQNGNKDMEESDVRTSNL